ncbi:MAG: hypothetical protein AAGC93_26555, partial [Cyanobacteria bacterium P01_F01_bin.53]
SVVIQPVSNIPYLVGVGMFVAFSDGKARRRRSRFGENFKKNFALSSIGGFLDITFCCICLLGLTTLSGDI